MIARNVLDLIGNTPMVQINHLNQNPSLEIYVKLEKFNAGGSVKDRIAKYMIEQAEKTGALNRDNGMRGGEDLARRIVSQNPDKYFMPFQFSNQANVLAHYETTAEEIWRDTKGRVTHFVD